MKEEENLSSLVAFKISPSEHKALKNLADKTGLTVSDILRLAVKEILKNSDNELNRRFLPVLFRFRQFESLILETKDRLKMLIDEINRFKEEFNR